MRHGSLFSGIGGFDLAAQWAGWINIFHCEWNPFGQTVLKYYWPEAISYDDIKRTDFAIHRGGIDILTGGFPCQPYSTAGKRLGKEDDRHLWPEMLRAIREIQPTWVVGENVRGLTNWNGGLVFDEVQADLENEGYEVTPFLLPACAVNAPHRRDRIWFVAYSAGFRCERNVPAGQGIQRENKTCREAWAGDNEDRAFTDSNGEFARRSRWEKEADSDKRTAREHEQNRTALRNRFDSVGCVKPIAHSHGKRQSELNVPDLAARSGYGFGIYNAKPGNWEVFPTQSPVCDGDDGFSSELDRDSILEATRAKSNRGSHYHRWRSESTKAAGNAIVPQVAYQIFKAINKYMQQ